MLLALQKRARWCAHGILLLSVLVASAACNADRTSPRFSPNRIRISDGDGQHGPAGIALARELEVLVLDESGEPEPGAIVEWTVDDGGRIGPQEMRTDNGGHSRAAWSLGTAAGSHAAHASFGDEQVTFTATTDPTFDGRPVPLALETYDGSGQTVHPDFVALSPSTSVAWGWASQVLAITPYPGGNASYENPSLYAGNDLTHWNAPPGVNNPIVRPSGGYLSDPDAVFVPETHELWLYYRAVTMQNEIRVTRTSDGTHWTPAVLVAAAPNHDIVSPTIVRRGATEWYMWSVNSNEGCTASHTTIERRTSADGVHWSSPQTVTLEQTGFSPWHIDVQWIESRREYWALFNGKTAGSCTTPALFLATSANGVHWTTFASPVLAAGVIREFEDVVYRSTFAYDAATDVMTFWYSGARYERGEYIFSSAVQQRARAEVFATASSPRALAATLGTRRDVPPLLDAP